VAFSQAVVFGLVALVGLSSFLTVMGVYERSQSAYTYALKVYRDELVDAAQTSIRIVGISVSGSTLTITLSNNGSTTLYDYSHFALIVDYYANVSGAAVLSVALYNYSSPPLAAYEWTSLSGELYPHAVGRFEVALPYPPYAGLGATVVVATNYGPEAYWGGVL